LEPEKRPLRFFEIASVLVRLDTFSTNLSSMNYWEIIADNLSKAGWSWGCVSAIDSHGRTIFVADAHRGEQPPQ